MNPSQLSIDFKILTINQAICKNIDSIDPSDRGFLSQNILAQMRNFVEHVMLKIWQHPNDVDNSYDNICKSIEFVKAKGDLKFLRRFHDYLQIVASHYTLDEDGSERLMLKYYEYILRLKALLEDKYSMVVLENIEKFPIDIDSGLKEYHEKIAARLDRPNSLHAGSIRKERYYIQKIKPFFVNSRIYYEVTFTSTSPNASKFDRVIAFTSLDISPFYAAKLSIVDDSISIMGKTMPILVVVDWEVSIRPCEIENFSRIFGNDLNTIGKDAEYRELMRFLTVTGFHLVEIIDFPDSAYDGLKQTIISKGADLKFFYVLDKCRDMTKRNRDGQNVVRYLLLRLNNRIIKAQIEFGYSNSGLSRLCLKNKCIPFEKMPFNTSLIGHNPRISDLFESLQPAGRMHELLARFIKNNTEVRGRIYTPIKDADKFGDAKALVSEYNRRVWSGHQGRKINELKGHFYISEYQENTLIALHRLQKLASAGIQNHSNSVNSWLGSNAHLIDCEEKKKALIEMFEKSMVALIYGPAGTGKSTIINHISHFFAKYSKLYLANTNPAVENLKRKVDAAKCEFSTIAKALKNNGVTINCDLLIIDECSTVSNQDIKEILEKVHFKLLILVGDTYQIESIRFGNWFGVARNFIPDTSVFELTKPYRTQNAALLELWSRVRNKTDTIIELISRNKYSCALDASVFDHANDEEIILCLNYDGLYGINNINRFLQQSNPSSAFLWGVHNYKVNDPILFNESNRFSPLIHNNMKGKIVGIDIIQGGSKIQFDILLDKAVNGFEAAISGLTLLRQSVNGNSVVRFAVNKFKSTDEDDDGSASDIVPFQVAYAVSIHKAQGLEYESVKIVITDETDELITHNIFYTAITRARKKLKIYWSPEVENKILARFKSQNGNKDVALLKLFDPTLGAAS